MTKSPPLKPQSKSLHQLTEKLQQLDEWLDTLEGENITPNLQEAVDELLSERAETYEAIEEKYDNYCALIQSRQKLAEARKSEAERMTKLAESDLQTVAFLKARLKENMETTERKKIRTRRFQISICSNGGKRPLVFNVDSPEELPKRFQRAIVESNNESLREALEAGEELDCAFLGERGTHLRIK